MRNRKTEAIVAIALKLINNRDDIAGPSVSDEELAAFLEGGLDQLRRVQVTSYIANDEEVYSRWIRLVEDFNEFDFLSRFSSNANSKAIEVTGFLSSVRQLLHLLLFRPALVSGGVFSFIAVAFFAFSLFQAGNNLDRLYEDYSATGAANTLSLPTRSFALPNNDVTITSEDEAIIQGIDQGLIDLDVMLEESSSRVGVRIGKNTAFLSAEDINVYRQLGRWSVITHLHCMQNNLAFQKASYPVFKEIKNTLAKSSSDYNKMLNKLFDESAQKTGDYGLCLIATAIFSKLALLNN